MGSPSARVPSTPAPSAHPGRGHGRAGDCVRPALRSRGPRRPPQASPLVSPVARPPGRHWVPSPDPLTAPTATSRGPGHRLSSRACHSSSPGSACACTGPAHACSQLVAEGPPKGVADARLLLEARTLCPALRDRRPPGPRLAHLLVPSRVGAPPPRGDSPSRGAPQCSAPRPSHHGAPTFHGDRVCYADCCLSAVSLCRASVLCVHECASVCECVRVRVSMCERECARVFTPTNVFLALVT